MVSSFIFFLLGLVFGVSVNDAWRDEKELNEYWRGYNDGRNGF